MYLGPYPYSVAGGRRQVREAGDDTGVLFEKMPSAGGPRVLPKVPDRNYNIGALIIGIGLPSKGSYKGSKRDL